MLEMNRVPHWMQISSLLVASLVLSACVTETRQRTTIKTSDGQIISQDGVDQPSEDSSDVDATRNIASLATSEYLRVGELAPQELLPGECGMFLFAGKPSPRFVFFAEAVSGQAKMLIEDQLVTFVRTGGEGPVFDLHFSRQSYEAAMVGISLVIDAEPEDIENASGTRLKSGSLRLNREDGWTMVMPVGGATTCMPAP